MSVDEDELYQREIDSLRDIVIELEKRVNELEFAGLDDLKELSNAHSNVDEIKILKDENKILKDENKRMTKDLKITHDCLEASVKEINRLKKP